MVRGETKIKANLATPFERRALKLINPSPVLRTTQVTYLDDGQPIEYCESVFHGEPYELTFAATS